MEAHNGAHPSLRRLAYLVTLDVNRTFGGYAAMELLRRTFTARGWLDTTSHAVFTAVSRLTPGTNLLAYCVTLGWRLRRFAGALVALGASSIPASVIVFTLAATLVRVDRYAAVQIGLAVGILVASALVLASAWNLIKPYFGRHARMKALIITAVAGVLIAAGATPVRTLLVAAAVGFFFLHEDVQS
jgi:chromate transporter